MVSEQSDGNNTEAALDTDSLQEMEIVSNPQCAILGQGTGSGECDMMHCEQVDATNFKAALGTKSLQKMDIVINRSAPVAARGGARPGGGRRRGRSPRPGAAEECH